ncbi:outer membrane lipoprotein carrier protein LolA [Sporosarcina sp. FSL W7-1349]|uniref:LolA family protein n=1 Tax=Sporosarcina sp. FSL W7-1349 TaxID=2921561 RepID=UPI0030F593C0
MNWIKPLSGISILLFFAIGLAACNTGESKFSPQEVLNTALQDADQPLAYYGEYTIKMNDDSSDIETKEWVAADGKRRIEMTFGNGAEQTITVNDGKHLSMYDKATNTAMIAEITEEDLNMLGQQSPRQQAERMLELIYDSHELSTGSEEVIAGRAAYHIIAKAKDSKTLIGDQEIWIDKETWIVLKSISESNELTMTQEYTKIDFAPELTDDLFVLKIPEGAAVEVIDEASMAPKEVTVEEVQEALGSYYQVPETEELKLSAITVDGLEERPEFSFDYTKNDIPAFSVTVFKEMPNVVSFGGIPNEEEITIRGKKGTKTESGNFRLLNWVEDGLRYSVILQNPELSFEEVEKYLNQMNK